jgi:hypothetical protein
LIDHPHIHCIVPGGGLSLDGQRWISTKRKFFVPVRVLSCLFRGKFIDYLKKAYDSAELNFAGNITHIGKRSVFNQLLYRLYGTQWVVYCKPPLKNPEKVIDYLGRYTHRVALSNDRIENFEGDQVTIRYRDSSDSNKIKLMTLSAVEFIRRFLLHVLPDGFIKIRHYGILSNRSRKTKLSRCKHLLGVSQGQGNENQDKASWQDMLARICGIDPRICPYCGKGKMVLRELLMPRLLRSPPMKNAA